MHAASQIKGNGGRRGGLRGLPALRGIVSRIKMEASLVLRRASAGPSCFPQAIGAAGACAGSRPCSGVGLLKDGTPPLQKHAPLPASA